MFLHNEETLKTLEVAAVNFNKPNISIDYKIETLSRRKFQLMFKIIHFNVKGRYELQDLFCGATHARL